MELVAPIDEPCAWRGQDIAHALRWTRELLPQHIEEFDAALEAIERRGIAWDAITAAGFPCPPSALTGQIDLIA